MKQFLFILVLGLGLVTLTACGLSSQTGYKDGLLTENDSPAPASPAATVPATGSSVLTDGNYKVDAANSRLAWQAAKITATHTGLVAVKSGSLQVTGGTLTGASFILDMPSISNDQNIDALVKHLKSPDFFDVATYPEASLVVTSVQPGQQPGEYLLSGDLTVKNVKAPVSFTAQISESNGVLEAKSSFSIDRTKWGIKYLSGNFFKDLGDKAIEDTIKFEVSLRASR